MKKGFTLIELMIVIAIVAIFVAIILPMFGVNGDYNEAKESRIEYNWRP